MFDNNNKSFIKELESSFKNEVAEKLNLNNLAITGNFNQRYSSFQTGMLQTIKDVVVQMIPKIPQQQQPMQTPSFQNAFHPQQMLLTASFPSQSVLQTQPHLFSFPKNHQHLNILTNIQQPSSPTNIPSPSTQSSIPPQSFTQNPSTPQQLSPHIKHQIANPSESQHFDSQSSFDKSIRAIDSDL